MIQFTPMRRQYTRVYLPNVSGGFDVGACPNPEALAETIVTSCNAHNILVEALDSIASFAVGHGDVCEIIASRAREALATLDAK